MKRVLTGLLLAGLCGTAAADIKLTGRQHQGRVDRHQDRTASTTGGFKTIKPAPWTGSTGRGRDQRPRST